MNSSSSEQGSVGESIFPRFKACSEVGRCILAWKEISNKTDTVWIRITTERLKFSVHKTQYRELTRQISQFKTPILVANALLYKRMYQTMSNKFEKLQYLERNLDKKLDKFKRRERKYERMWVKHVRNVSYDWRTMSLNDIRVLRNRFIKGIRQAKEILETLKILQAQRDMMKIEMNADVQDCIQRAQDLLNLLKTGGHDIAIR